MEIMIGDGRIARCIPSQLAYNTYSVGDTIGQVVFKKGDTPEPKIEKKAEITKSEKKTTESEDDDANIIVGILLIIILIVVIVVIIVFVAWLFG